MSQRTAVTPQCGPAPVGPRHAGDGGEPSARASAPGPARATELRTLRSFAELASLAASWTGLRSALDSPMQTPAWLEAAGATFSDLEPHFVCVLERRDTGPPTLAALAALARRPGRGRRLENLAGRELAEPLDVLWRDEEALAELCGHLADERRPLLLARQPLDSPALSALRAAYRGRAAVAVTGRRGLPVIDLDPDATGNGAQLSSRRRSDLRRARRRAEAIGAVETDVLAPHPDELDALLATALEVEAASWKGRAGSALLHDPARLGFFRRYARAAAAAGELRIAFLRIGGSPAAMQLAVVHGDAWWVLKIGYDERFARCSPGQLLFGETVATAARAGLERYELLGGSDPWTRAWTTRERPCATVLVYPARPAVLPLLVADAGRLAQRELRRRR